jgi:hypothetical protein
MAVLRVPRTLQAPAKSSNVVVTWDGGSLLNSIKAKIARNGRFETKAGIIRRRLGRLGAEPDQLK